MVTMMMTSTMVVLKGPLMQVVPTLVHVVRSMLLLGMR